MTTSRSDPAQADALDYIIDNARMSRREVYRNGDCIVMFHKSLESNLIRHFSGADKPFGHYPDVQGE